MEAELRRPLKDEWAIRADKTALVVIDMQRAFVDRGAPLECIGASELVPKINELAATCRRLGIPVVFVKATRSIDQSNLGLVRDMITGDSEDEMRALDGRKGAEFCDGLDTTQDDYVVPKKHYSALIARSSELESLLRSLGRDSFIICGVATDVCVGTTTADGMMLGFKVFLVGDLTATYSKERQMAALEVYDKHFAKVVTFDTVMKELANL